MPIRIHQGADPLGDGVCYQPELRVPINAQCEAGRVLSQELTRYCGGEIRGRSFLIAGHRGAGKTTMVADAVDRVLRASVRPAAQLLQPLPVFLHGPSLFEFDELPRGKAADAAAAQAAESPSAGAATTARMAEQARAALTQIILGLHRAVAREFSLAYRMHIAGSARLQALPEAPRREYAELAAQFELELAGDPTPARLREFWALAEALDTGLLAPAASVGRSGRGALELVALSGMCEAYRRISGELSSELKEQEQRKREAEISAGLTLKGAELVRPVVSVLSGLAVAGGVGGTAAGSGSALLAGLATALASSLMFSSTSRRSESRSRQVDTTFIPDLSLKTLDRVMPTLLQRLRDAGLAPVLIVDELDKVECLSERLVAVIHFLKKLLAENVFTCFLTDRGYMEQLRLESKGAYSRSYSYFSHPLLVSFQPADFHVYLKRLLQPDGPTVSDADAVDLAVLPWMLRFRAELHALTLAREISLLRGDDGLLVLGPGVVRTETGYLIAITFQVMIELQLAQSNVVAWLRLHPERGQTLVDALYYPSRCWVRGERRFAWGEHVLPLKRYLVERMNLDRAVETEVLSDLAGSSADEVLPADDVKLFIGVLDDMVRLMCETGTATLIQQRWDSLPARPGLERVAPTQEVVAAMLLGERASLLKYVVVNDEPVYMWRYRPSGMERDPVSPVEPVHPIAALGRQLDADIEEAMDVVRRIEDVENVLKGLLQSVPDLPAGEQVFELLADQLRVLQTTPAWAPTRAAIANVRLARANPGAPVPLQEHLATVRRFAEMLETHAGAVASALTLAAYVAGTRYEGAHQSEGLRHALWLLSEGLGFDRLYTQGLQATVDEVRLELEERVHEPLEFVGLADVGPGLDSLPLVVAAAFAQGHAQSPRHVPDWLASAAWSAARERIETPGLTHATTAGRARAVELLAAIAGVGPTRLLRLSIEATPLLGWSRLLLQGIGLADEVLTEAGVIPDWTLAAALRRLGAETMTRTGREQVGRLLLHAGRRGAGASLPLDAFTAGPSRGAGPAGDRLALCVLGADDSPMRDWVGQPTQGLVLMLGIEQLWRLQDGRLRPAIVVAYDGILAEPEPPPPLPLPLYGAPLVWIYREPQLDMQEPALIAPKNSDPLFGFARRPGDMPSSAS